MLINKKLSLSLPESVVNIEEKSRSNLFTWRGQFSPQLIESLLKAYARLLAPHQTRRYLPQNGNTKKLPDSTFSK